MHGVINRHSAVSEKSSGVSVEILQRIADNLREVRAKVHFSGMDGEVAYYSALSSMASCIEDAVAGLK